MNTWGFYIYIYVFFLYIYIYTLFKRNRWGPHVCHCPGSILHPQFLASLKRRFHLPCISSQATPGEKMQYRHRHPKTWEIWGVFRLGVTMSSPGWQWMLQEWPTWCWREEQVIKKSKLNPNSIQAGRALWPQERVCEHPRQLHPLILGIFEPGLAKILASPCTERRASAPP